MYICGMKRRNKSMAALIFSRTVVKTMYLRSKFFIFTQGFKIASKVGCYKPLHIQCKDTQDKRGEEGRVGVIWKSSRGVP